MAELRRRFPLSGRGLNLKQISDIASSLNMLARPIKCELEELRDLKTPAILHWGLTHFVVLIKATNRHIVVHNPSQGRVTLKYSEAGKLFTGAAVELSEAPEFKRRREKSPLSIWAWIRPSRELFSGLGQILVLSLLLQAYTLVSPLFIQLPIDQSALKGDMDLLSTLAIGFGLFGLFNVGAGLLRNLAMQKMSAYLSWDMGLRLFRHLIRLPLPWFQKRRLADTLSRFESINPVRDLVSGSLIPASLDGVLAVTTLGLMFLFAWQLALLAVCGVALYGALRLASLPRVLEKSSEALRAQIAENGKRIESIKAIQTIKVMSAEAEQETQWSNRYSDFVRKTISKQNINTWVSSAYQVIEVVIFTGIVYVGVSSIIKSEMSIGIFYAFMSYRSQFNNAVSNVIDQAIQWKLSDIYSFRLADIVLTPKEERIDEVVANELAVRGEIEVESLSFRYAPYDAFIIKSLDLKVAPGEFIAIVGPSGVGKSTLLKLLCGLYSPVAGEIRLDGRPISAWGPRALRRALGVVMQDDELLSGTIAENVAFFDQHIEMDRVWEALEAASIAAEVHAMPMKADTFVGDMGGGLSGGQKQRLLIARALYKRPQILFMDEATSHLDTLNEGIINKNLKALNMTRFVIAHRMETIRSADRVFDLGRQSFVQFGDAAVKATKLHAID